VEEEEEERASVLLTRPDFAIFSAATGVGDGLCLYEVELRK
jgi:hypothetical protein